MNEREAAAQKMGLRDLQLLKLHGDNEPLQIVIAALRKRFGSHPTAFEPDVRNLPPAEYKLAQVAMLKNASIAETQGRQEAATARTMADMTRKYA